MYEMVAGEPPFTGPTARSIITRSLTETPRSLTISRTGLSSTVDSAIMKALAKSPADRYANAQQMVAALDRAQEGVRSGTSEYPIPAGPTTTQVWGLFALGCMGMLALVSAIIRQWSLPRWTIGFAVGLLAVGAVVLVLTGRMEARRRSGGSTPGLGRFFTWRFATLGGMLARPPRWRSPAQAPRRAPEGITWPSSPSRTRAPRKMPTSPTASATRCAGSWPG
jgi:hypothetical protein